MTLRCDACDATYAASNVPGISARDLLRLAERAGWEIEPARAPLRHYCPRHKQRHVEPAP